MNNQICLTTTFSHAWIRFIESCRIFDFVHENDRKGLGKKLDWVKKTKESLLLEFRVLSNSGNVLWLETNIKPVKNDDGTIREIVTASRDISNWVRAEDSLKKLAYTDYLTGLPNRREFINKLSLEKSIIDKSSSKVMAVCSIDGDGFKSINDLHGHDVGDRFLVKVGERLQSIVSNKDTIARIGGDEFALLLRCLTDEDEATTIAQHIRSV
ncbi:diguanylate cyclase domain-containing protein [Virgibacillus sp. DJP39]|uniref:PAS domain-containing protein n=1 Tax=Virgibacillus sp. DJP39 TaxID=3409790 RepID=UPI003BB7069E